jgi:ribonuclease Z
MKFELTLLGTSGAVPAYGRYPSMQVLNVQEQLYMIDCGEGAQIRFADYGIRWSKLSQIFISHLHGDHFYGLPGMISSMALNSRKKPLTVYGPAALWPMLNAIMPDLDRLPFQLGFEAIPQDKHELIFQDKRVKVYTLPLNHSIPASGFLFREKKRLRSMRGEMIARYQIPYQQIPAIKAGADYVAEDGSNIPNALLTTTPPKPRTYAYCSDTTYEPSLLPLIKEADLLYHESTFCERDRAQAETTMHSTASDAAHMAKQANVGQLVLGHYSSRYKYLDWILSEACNVFPNTILGMDGGQITVPLR